MSKYSNHIAVPINRRAGEGSSDPEAGTSELGELLHLAAGQFTGLLQSIVRSQPQETVLLQDLTRALTLTRATEGFEPVVRNAIRHYREIHSEVLRFRFKKGIPAKLRADILAGFERLLLKAKEDLELLSVRVTEVQPGVPLDLAKHQVVRCFSTASAEKLGCVARCVMPQFSWINPFGKERLEPAEVWAFTERSEKAKPTSKPSSNGCAVITSG